MEMILEPSIPLLKIGGGCFTDCCVLDCSFCAGDCDNCTECSNCEDLCYLHFS